MNCVGDLCCALSLFVYSFRYIFVKRRCKFRLETVRSKRFDDGLGPYNVNLFNAKNWIVLVPVSAESFKAIWSFRSGVHGTMNLDPLSLTLSQIGYLVVTLTKKNYQQVVEEIIKVGLHFFWASHHCSCPLQARFVNICLVAILSTH